MKRRKSYFQNSHHFRLPTTEQMVLSGTILRIISATVRFFWRKYIKISHKKPSCYSRYKSYLIPGETLIPGIREERLGKVLDMRHIYAKSSSGMSICDSSPRMLSSCEFKCDKVLWYLKLWSPLKLVKDVLSLVTGIFYLIYKRMGKVDTSQHFMLPHFFRVIAHLDNRQPPCSVIRLIEYLKYVP